MPAGHHYSPSIVLTASSTLLFSTCNSRLEAITMFIDSDSSIYVAIIDKK
jgi:uncharacterized membrane protein (UPF0182 family)